MSTGNRILIIAEIGECFNGDIRIAKKLIDVAKETDCDLVKFQTLDSTNISDSDPERDWLKKVSLNPKKIANLINYAKDSGIDILFTPENIETAGWLLDAELSNVKIASSSVTDAELVKFVGENFQKVFISTGMASLEEVHSAIDFLKNVPELYIMHCVSEYPTGPLLEQRGLKALSHENVNLNMMKILMKSFSDKKVGYSDHTSGILAPIAAAAMGAQVIEKHVTLDREIPIKNFNSGKTYLGTDHVLAIEPANLKKMILAIREIEKMLGPMEWQRSDGEKTLREFIRTRFS